jgi:hypothetical protein
VPPILVQALGVLLLARAASRGLRAVGLLIEVAVLGALGWWLLGGQVPALPPEIRGWLDAAVAFFRNALGGVWR